MPCKDITYFNAISDEKAWQHAYKYLGRSAPLTTNFSDLFSSKDFIALMTIVSVATTFWRIRPEKMTPNMMKWFSGFAAVTFMACYAVFMADQGKQLFSDSAALSYLICAPIALFANLMVLFQRRSYYVRPHSSEPWRLHHAFYLFIAVQYLCIRYCLDKAPLGCVPNSKFLAYQIRIGIMTAYNYNAACFLGYFIYILFAKKFVIFDEEDGEGRIIDPQPEKESVDVEDLVRDIQGLIEDIKTTKGDVQDDLDDLKEANENLKDVADYVMVFKPLAAES